MILLIILILFIITIYFISSKRNEGRTGGSNVSNDFDISDYIFFNPYPVILSSTGQQRPVNVPLTPFVSPLKINYIIDPVVGIPNFILYKTQYLSPIVDQGQCGSCWAFSIVNMLSDRISILTLGKFKELLSTEQLMSCFEPESACVGNSPENALLWLQNTRYKLVTAKQYPYTHTVNTNVEKGNCPATYDGVNVRDVKSICQWIEEKNYDKNILNENIKNMKLELINNGPFICAMSVYPSFYTYSGEEVYQPSEGEQVIGGHAINVIGYCERDPRYDNEGYWICRNSWGTNWPLESKNRGFFIIKMGSNICGIESRCISANPDISDINYGTIQYTRWQSYNNFINSLRPGEEIKYI
jgi:C1A family cysteine protease